MIVVIVVVVIVVVVDIAIGFFAVHNILCFKIVKRIIRNAIV